MSFIVQDKTRNFVKEILPQFISDKSQNPLDTTISDIVTSYLPAAFDTLTRGINSKSLSVKLKQVLPPLLNEISTPKLRISETIDLIGAYLDNHETLIYLLDSLKDSDKTISELLNCINNEDWNNPLFNDPNVDLYLLLAVKNGLLTQFEFTSMTLFLMAKKKSEHVVVMPYFENGKVNEVARNLLKESFKFDKRRLLADPVLSDGNYLEFEEELIKRSPTERNLYLTPASLFLLENTVLEEVNSFGFNLFGKVQHLRNISKGLPTSIVSTHSQITAPLGLIDVFLKIKFGKNAVELEPVIGEMPVAVLKENGLYGTRVVGIDSSVLPRLNGLKYPTKADGYPAPPLSFYWHDACYHSYLSSSVPHELRQRFIQCGNLINENLKEFLKGLINQNEIDLIDLFYRKLAFSCIDMEHAGFRPEYVAQRPVEYSNPLGIFWSSIGARIYHIFDEIFAENWQISGKFSSELRSDCIIHIIKQLVKNMMITKQDSAAISDEIKWFALTSYSTSPVISSILQLIKINMVASMCQVLQHRGN